MMAPPATATKVLCTDAAPLSAEPDWDAEADAEPLDLPVVAAVDLAVAAAATEDAPFAINEVHDPREQSK